MIPKSYPVKWTAAQISFFAGYLTGYIDAGSFLQAMAQTPGWQPDYSALVKVLEPKISAGQWVEAVRHCERIFL